MWQETELHNLEDSDWRAINGNLSFTVCPEDAPYLESEQQAKANILIIAPKEINEKTSVLVDVVNRGMPLMWNICEDTAPNPMKQLFFGKNNFFKDNNICYVACGWQTDLISRPGFLTVETETINKKGKIMCELDTSSQHMQLRPDIPVDNRNLQLCAKGHLPIPVIEEDINESELFELDTPNSKPQKISNENWQFGRFETIESEEPIKDLNSICMKSGFTKGKIYQIVYHTNSCNVGGIGLHAIKECGKWLKNGSDCPYQFNKVFAVGGSQTGRFLRTFIYEDFNYDKTLNSDIFDGFFVCVAGSSQGQFNQLFGQPSMSMPHLATQRFPFGLSYSEDPITNEKGGLCDKFKERKSKAKLIFFNTTVEYHRGDASLLHIDVMGKNDLDLSDENIRYYVLGGSPHNPFSNWPPSYGDSPVPIGNIQQTLTNIVDFRPFFRNMIFLLNQWICNENEPPQNIYPTLKDKTLTYVKNVYNYFENIPNIVVPKEENYPFVFRRDFGFNKTHPGICDNILPIDGDVYEGSCFVPKVDNNGNELGVILMPMVAVPLASFTGWSLRHPDFGGENKLMMVSGSTIPFSWNNDGNDPRSSVIELYKTKDNYLDLVKQNATKLAENNFILKSDIGTCVDSAANLWDWLENQNYNRV